MVARSCSDFAGVGERAPYANLYADARWPNGFVDNKTGTQVNAENYRRTK
jgi:hypothetical protein